MQQSFFLLSSLFLLSSFFFVSCIIFFSATLCLAWLTTIVVILTESPGLGVTQWKLEDMKGVIFPDVKVSQISCWCSLMLHRETSVNERVEYSQMRGKKSGRATYISHILTRRVPNRLVSHVSLSQHCPFYTYTFTCIPQYFFKFLKTFPDHVLLSLETM